MYPKLNILNVNVYKKAIERNNSQIKNIGKLLNSQYSNSFKNPFSNVMLRKKIIHQKIKTLNQYQKNLSRNKNENKKKSFRQNNLYIHFSEIYNQNKQKLKNINIDKKMKINNSFDEKNIFRIIKNNNFSPNKKLYKSRNIYPLKLLPSKTIHNLKFKSFTKEYKDKRIVFINDRIVKINRMNITIYNPSQSIRPEEKNFQMNKKSLPKIEESKNSFKLNDKIKNITFRNNNNTSRIKSLKTAQMMQYLKNSRDVLFKNKINNKKKKGNENIYKSISADRNNNLFNEYSSRNKEDFLTITPLSNEMLNQKKNRINIFALLSLKDKGNSIIQ